MHRARERLVKLAKKTGVDLRQSYARVGKHALIAHQRYAHAKQFKRANRALKTIRTYLGRVIRDIVGEVELESVFAHPLMLARRARDQRQHQRGRKVYSLHAPEVECIGKGKGKAHRPYEFGVKVSLATTLHRSKGGQFIAHAKALPGNPYDGHTLATVSPEIETQIGASLARIAADRGYRGHNAPPDHKFKVYISGQRRRVTETIKRELRRRSAVEPVIGHSKAEHHMGRNYLAGTATPQTRSSPPPATTSAPARMAGRLLARLRHRDPRRRRGRSDPLARLPLRFIETRRRASRLLKGSLRVRERESRRGIFRLGRVHSEEWASAMNHFRLLFMLQDTLRPSEPEAWAGEQDRRRQCRRRTRRGLCRCRAPSLVRGRPPSCSSRSFPRCACVAAG
jgi:hypothetical protein